MQRSRKASKVSLFVIALSVAAGAQAAPAAAAPKTYAVAVSSEAALPTTVRPDQLPAGDDTVSANASTPSGFALRNPGIRRSDYVYDSDTVYQGSYRCTSTMCTLAAEVKVQLHQEAIGGSSHTWRLTQNMNYSRNPGGLSWSYSATYWCGVNISLAGDELCTNGAAPSNASMNVNTVVNKPWGSTNSITVFPMVQASTIFSNGVTVTTKFRGWDTLSRSSTTRLATSSDG